MMNSAGRVVGASGVAIERISTVGRVPAGRCVVKERTGNVSCVVGAGVAIERTGAVGRVVGAGGVAIERFKTVGCVLDAGCVAKERTKTVGRVAEASGDAG